VSNVGNPTKDNKCGLVKIVGFTDFPEDTGKST